MPWLYVPRTFWPSEPVDAELNLASNWSCQKLASSVTWRGKLSRLQTWRQRLKRVSWMRHLSGLMWRPSTAAAIVDMWISCLSACLVSPSPPRVSAKASKTNAGSGPMSGESFAKWNPDTSSWKRFGDLFNQDFPTPSETWPIAGGLRNGTCFLRQRWELAIGAQDFSSLPTPSVAAFTYNQGGQQGRVGKKRYSLEALAKRNKLPCHPRGLLNPEWIEQAMGWPIGMTDVDSAAMESYRLWRRLHGAYSESVLRKYRLYQ